MEQRTILKKIFDRLIGITEKDYKACAKLEELTGLPWTPHRETRDEQGTYNTYGTPVKDRETGAALRQLMLDVFYPGYQRAYSIGGVYLYGKQNYFALTEAESEPAGGDLAHFRVPPSFDKQKFQEALQQKLAEVAADEATKGSKFLAYRA